MSLLNIAFIVPIVLVLVGIAGVAILLVLKLYLFGCAVKELMPSRRRETLKRQAQQRVAEADRRLRDQPRSDKPAVDDITVVEPWQEAVRAVEESRSPAWSLVVNWPAGASLARSEPGPASESTSIRKEREPEPSP